MTVTVPVLHATVAVLIALIVGYLAGRSAYRRKLQTTEGRVRAGVIRPPSPVAACTDFAPLDDLLGTDELPATAQLPVLGPETRPVRALRAVREPAR